MVVRVDGERFDAGDKIAELLPTIRLGDGNYTAAGQSIGPASSDELLPHDLIRYSAGQKSSKGGKPTPLGFCLWISPKEASE
ncbi:MAG: hypothetical protein AAF805_00860 [Planctomycetota bacterium]